MDVGASKGLSWEGGCRDMAGGAIDVEGHRGHGCRGIERAVVGRWLPGYGRGAYRCRGAFGAIFRGFPEGCFQRSREEERRSGTTLEI